MKQNKIIKNYLLNSMYQMLSVIFPFFLTPYLTRTLGSGGIGQYSYYSSCASYFVLFSVLGIPNYGNRMIARIGEDRERRTQVFWEIYKIQAIMSVLVLWVYLCCVHVLFQDNRVGWMFGIYVAASAFDITWLFFGMEQFMVTVARNLLIKAGTLILVLVFVKNESDTALYALIFSSGTFLANLLLLPAAGKALVRRKHRQLCVKTHIRSVLVLFVPCLAVSIYKVMDKVMLGLMTQMQEVGFYECSERLVNIPMLFVTSLSTVMIPRISHLVGRAEDEESGRYLYRSVVWVMFLTSGMSFGIAGVADVFVPLFFGEGFETCIMLLQILMPSCLFLGFANVIRTQYLLPRGMDLQYVVSVIIGAVSNFLLNLFLIPRYASVGAAAGTLLTEGIVCICQCVGVSGKLPLSRYLQASRPFLLAGLLMGIVVKSVNFSQTASFRSLLFKIGIGGVVYVLALALLYPERRRKNEI